MGAFAGARPFARAGESRVHGVVAAVVIAWAILGIGGVTGHLPGVASYAVALLAAGPAVCITAMVMLRAHSAAWLPWALAVTTTVAGAGLAVRYAFSPTYAIAPAGAALSALATLRRPGLTIAAIVVLSGTHASIEVYTLIPVGPLIDVLLVGLWAGLLWGWAFELRRRPDGLHPGLVILALFILVSVVYALLATPLEQGLYAWRLMAWYMLGGILCSLLLTSERQQRIAVRGFAMAAAVVGGYAMLRWAIGPGAKEEQQALGGGPFVLDNAGDLRLVGSLLNPSALGIWCAPFVGYAVAVALAPGPRLWRVLALFGAGTCFAAIFGTETRIAVVGAGAAAVSALALFAVSRAYGERRIAPLVVGVVLALAGATAFAAIELTDETSRFRGLLDPSNDYSLQDRTNKWESVLADMDEHPFGHGLGSTGGAELRYARFNTIATFDPDSAYVKVAYDQGYAAAALFIVALIAMLVALGIRAIGTADPGTATRAIGGFAALTALIVAMLVGMYNEGLSPMAVWIAVGVGLAPITAAARDRDAEDADADAVA